ncbi:hypothetical protein ACEPPN_009709 [Leptodophora sp. 'Broadleaf-Isolate-01']
MVIVMIVGILFASHVYYHALGGQGFLKAKRQEEESKENISTQLYLPMRKLETVVQGKSSWGLIGRSPKNIPFYTCGDQLNSCQTFDQPKGLFNVQKQQEADVALPHWSAHQMDAYMLSAPAFSTPLQQVPFFQMLILKLLLKPLQ